MEVVEPRVELGLPAAHAFGELTEVVSHARAEVTSRPRVEVVASQRRTVAEPDEPRPEVAVCVLARHSPPMEVVEPRVELGLPAAAALAARGRPEPDWPVVRGLQQLQARWVVCPDELMLASPCLLLRWLLRQPMAAVPARRSRAPQQQLARAHPKQTLVLHPGSGLLLPAPE
jgi:hypothetical protein